MGQNNAPSPLVPNTIAMVPRLLLNWTHGTPGTTTLSKRLLMFFFWVFLYFRPAKRLHLQFATSNYYAMEAIYIIIGRERQSLTLIKPRMRLFWSQKYPELNYSSERHFYLWDSLLQFIFCIDLYSASKKTWRAD